MLAFSPVPIEDFEEVFQLTKLGLHDFVDAVFGWDDDMQRRRIRDEYEWCWMHWVTLHDNRIGLVCFKPYAQALHVHLLLLYPQWQRQGLGSQIMGMLHAQAALEQRDITLSAFRVNTAAVALYRKLGYQVESEEPDFLLFRRIHKQESL